MTALSSIKRPLVTVDVVIFGVLANGLSILLMQRPLTDDRQAGRWALPGGIVDVERDDSLESVALRKLQEKTGVKAPYLEQFGTFGGPDRDPAGWSVTTVYYALVDVSQVALRVGEHAEKVGWFRVDRLPKPLAFDHQVICRAAIERFRARVEYTSLPAHLLPAEFTLRDLQAIYEVVLGRPMDKASFRRRMLDAGFMEEAPGQRTDPRAKRPSQLYRIRRGARLAYFPRTFKSGEGVKV